ncbi:hypothetical protein F5B21DRAFT_501436 [Xylaria acuta]|nr:hypothetical protein F5B21DRAFT_501436 [Xylaria acuta]
MPENNMSKNNNMEIEQEGASSQPPNYNTPTLASVPTNNEAADIEDLRKRFTAMESKITAVGDVFGLRGLAEAAEEEDSDSGSDSSSVGSYQDYLPPKETKFFSDAAYFMRNAREAHQRIQRFRDMRRRNKKMAKKMVMGRVDKAQQKSVRQISTTAFLKSEPATVTWMDWGRFLRPIEGLEKSVMAPIDAVVGEPEPQLMLQSTAHYTQSSNSIADGSFGGTRTSTENLEQTLLPERIRISSIALPSVIERFSVAGGSFRAVVVAGDGTVMFLRPFRRFIYFEKQMREHLDELEKRFEDWDGTGKPPMKGGDNAVTKDGSEESGDPKADFLNIDSTKEEKVKEGGREERSSEPERHNTESEGETDDEYERDDTESSITALLHLRCLMKFVNDEIKPKLRHIESDRCRRIFFHDLWHLFKPGGEVVDQTEKQAYRVIRVQTPKHRVEDPWLRWSSLSDEDAREDGTPVTVHCAYIDFNGKQLGPVSVKFSISPFGGLKDIKLLPIYPLRFAKDSNLRDNLVARGRMLLNIAKFKPMYYMGFTLDTRDEIDSQVVVDFSEALADEKRKEWRPTIEPLRTTTDIIIETPCPGACCFRQATYEDKYIDTQLTTEFLKSLVPNTSLQAPSLILSPRPLEEAMPGTDDEPTDDEFVIMTYRVFGFVLRSRKWAQLDLTFLKYENTDVRNSALGAFDRLELPDGHREMVKSLVTQHFRDRQTTFTKNDQTDLVRGKGKGLIMLLHGAPGVGKTTTAEGVAELFQKPLFQITCGDLGTTAREVEQELEKNFALASRWGCILLLDEADVFLSARERKDFERNGLVAVFLRVLEYYAGILFLTTNRIGDFDEAFASRIHMSLYYPELDEPKTKKVFKLNLDLIQERFDKQGRKITYDASSIEDFAKKHFSEHPYSRWNGRQIRNACQTALALAEFDAHGGKIQSELDKKVEVKLQLKHFQLVQTAYLDFGHYLGDIRGTQGDRRAIDYGFRAKSNTPYQTTPSRFSAGMRDSHRSSSLSAEHSNDYNSHYPSQPFTNQGGVGSNMEHQYGQYNLQQMGPGVRYESTQGHGYAHPGNQQGMDPRRYQQPPNPQGQGQNWGNLGPGMSQGYPPAGQSQHAQGPTPQGQTPQGQYYQGQPQYNFGNMVPGPGSTVQNQYSQEPGNSGPEGGGGGGGPP